MWSVPGEGRLPDPLGPSPPICVKPVTAESVRRDRVTRVWQPMPPPAIEASGTAVERLCGQPEQKYGVRLIGSSGSDGRSGWAASIGTQSPRTRRSGSMSRPGVSSPSAGTSGLPSRSFLPTTFGRSASGQVVEGMPDLRLQEGVLSSTTKTFPRGRERSR